MMDKVEQSRYNHQRVMIAEHKYRQAQREGIPRLELLAMCDVILAKIDYEECN